MNKGFVLTFSALMLLSALKVSVSAQNQAISVLDQAAEAYEKAEGVKASFKIEVLSPGGEASDPIEGFIQLKGSKFKLTVGEEMITWFDGKNQWLYFANNQEVNLSSPTEEEQLMVNPVNVFKLYRYGYNSRLLGEKKYGSANIRHIEMTPQDTNSDTQSITVYFDKASNLPLYICIANKDKSGSIIRITNYQTHQNYPDNIFMFQQKDYPMAEVIDLR